MKNTNVNFDLKALPQQLSLAGRRIAPYVPILFFVLVAIVYGFVLLRITMLANAQPKGSDVSAQAAALTPHIDKSAVNQLQGLEDNSVNVQTLFVQARNNPFGE